MEGEWDESVLRSEAARSQFRRSPHCAWRCARAAPAQDTTIHVNVRLVRMLVTVKDANGAADRVAEQERFHGLRQRRQAGHRGV